MKGDPTVTHGRLYALILVLFAGCASAPPERFYALSSALPERAAPGESTGTVVVGRAALPEVADRPQLVTAREGNRVTILDQQRWAEPLRVGVPRVVAEDLARLLGWRASTNEDVIVDPDCRVALDIRRFDARPAVAVAVEALWTVTCRGAERRLGRSAVTAPVAGQDLDAVVFAYGQALAAVSRDVAAAIQPRQAMAR
jgi:uncharacterized lipoprotein YmbA